MGTLQAKNVNTQVSASHSSPRGERDAASWAQHILSCIGDSVISTDISGKITYLNPAAERTTGWPLQEALGLPVAEVMKVIDAPPCEAPQSLTEAGIGHGAIPDLPANRILVRRDGTETVIEDSAAPIHDPKGRATGEVLVFRAITEEVRAKALRMARLAQYDWLTGLPNRMLLKDRIGRALALATRYSRPLAVLFLDLDRFKDVNDSAGHAIGDRVLQATAGRMLGCVRSSDTVSRYGGDEFVILLSEIDHSRSLMPIAKKLLTAIEGSHSLTPHVFRVTASIGISFFPQDGRDEETLIQRADAAMYCAKQYGGNNIQLFDERQRT